MTARFECPFCGHDCTSLIEAFRADRPLPGVTSSGLCGRCGEPMMVGRLGVRKPTDEEYTALGQDTAITMARKVWLESRRPDRLRSSTLDAIDKLVADLPPAFSDDDISRHAIHATALLGAANALSEVQRLLVETEGYDDFFTALVILEQEFLVEKSRLFTVRDARSQKEKMQ